MHTRRQFIKLAGLTGAILTVPGLNLVRRVGADPVPGGSLDPTGIPKYTRALVIPAAMPRTDIISLPHGEAADYYQIAVRQFQQQILPASLPPTTVWGYGSVGHPGSFAYPAGTIEAKYGRPVRVKWINDLKDSAGHYLPHLLPVDPTLHWANPPGGPDGRDTRPTFTATPKRYRGPVPTVPHLHGIEHIAQESDGFPEAWFLPAATNIPAGYATTGTAYDAFHASSALGALWTPGAAVFQYPNRQRATTLWYHDHTLGLTRANVYAGPAGFYLLRGGNDDAMADQLPGPAPARGDAPGTKYYEIPLIIQDRSFNANGSLFYPASREFFDGFAGPYIGSGDQRHLAHLEPGGLCQHHGRQRQHLAISESGEAPLSLPPPECLQLALPDPQALQRSALLADRGRRRLSAGTRDVRGAAHGAGRAGRRHCGLHPGAGRHAARHAQSRAGRAVRRRRARGGLRGGGPGHDGPGAAVSRGASDLRGSQHATPPAPPARIQAARPPHPHAAGLAERSGLGLRPAYGIGPRAGLLGIMGTDGMGMPMMWADAATETPALGSTEVWEIFNYTEDAHPVHPHTVQFQVVNRQKFDTATGALVGASRPPEPGETGFKDTIIAYPGEVTRIKAQFAVPGRFVWHCHILEHEDGEMMRPLVVT